MAANPTDPRKLPGIPGTPYENLNSQASPAIEACQAATAQYPNDLRLQYQLARALQTTDRRRALELLQRIANAGYPAAFDNLGWLYYIDQKNPGLALQCFIQGVKLNDPDAMVSLAGMIERKVYLVSNPTETRIALYKRAAELGSANAAKALAAEIQKSRRNLSQAEQQRMAIELMRQLFNRIPHR